MSRWETYSGDSCAGDDVSEGGVAGRYGTWGTSVDMFLCHVRRVVHVLRAEGEAKPGTSNELESWRAKEPYGLLSSSSHMTQSIYFYLWLQGCILLAVFEAVAVAVAVSGRQC
jgi:hypothetical protein